MENDTESDDLVTSGENPAGQSGKVTSPFVRFVRIFLLVLIVLGILLLVTQKAWVPSVVNMLLSRESTDTMIQTNTETTLRQNPYNTPFVGAYERTLGQATIIIAPVSSTEVTVSGDATWEGASPEEVNMGSFDATTSIQNNEIVIDNTDYSTKPVEKCIITIDFAKDGTATVTDSGDTCGWGWNVDFAGTYSKR